MVHISGSAFCSLEISTACKQIRPFHAQDDAYILHQVSSLTKHSWTRPARLRRLVYWLRRATEPCGHRWPNKFTLITVRHSNRKYARVLQRPQSAIVNLAFRATSWSWFIFEYRIDATYWSCLIMVFSTAVLHGVKKHFFNLAFQLHLFIF